MGTQCACAWSSLDGPAVANARAPSSLRDLDGGLTHTTPGGEDENGFSRP